MHSSADAPFASRRPRSALRAVWAAALLALVACAGTDPTPATPAGAGATCPAGGTPAPQDRHSPPPNCEILHEGCCYTEQAPACAAAGCEPGACVILESYPGQVSCTR